MARMASITALAVATGSKATSKAAAAIAKSSRDGGRSSRSLHSKARAAASATQTIALIPNVSKMA